METRAHHILIGLFALISLAAAIFFVMWLGNMNDDREFRYIDVIFKEAVTGLSKGSTVEFNGIKIGDVASLRLDTDDPKRVFARIRIDVLAPVRSDTRAHLVPAGITGLSIIRLTSGNDSVSVRLESGSGVVPQIVAETSALSKFIAEGGNVILNFNEVMTQARELFSAQNMSNVTQILAHFEQLSRSLKTTQIELDETLGVFRSVGNEATVTLRSVTPFLETADQTLKSVNRLVDTDVVETLTATQQSVKQFESAMRSLSQLIDDTRVPLDQGLNGVSQIGPVLIELRATLSSLRRITSQLEEKPLEYLLELQPAKEFTP